MMEHSDQGPWKGGTRQFVLEISKVQLESMVALGWGKVGEVMQIGKGVTGRCWGSPNKDDSDSNN